MSWDAAATRIRYRALRARARELRLSEPALVLLQVYLDYDLPEGGRRKGLVWPPDAEVCAALAPTDGDGTPVALRTLRRLRAELADKALLRVVDLDTGEDVTGQRGRPSGERGCLLCYDVLLGQPAAQLGGEPTQRREPAPEKRTPPTVSSRRAGRKTDTARTSKRTLPTVSGEKTDRPSTENGSPEHVKRSQRSVSPYKDQRGKNVERTGECARGRAAAPDLAAALPDDSGAPPVPPPDHPVWTELGLDADEELQRDAAAEIAAGVPLEQRRSLPLWDCEPLPDPDDAAGWQRLFPRRGFGRLRGIHGMPLYPRPEHPDWPSWADVVACLPVSGFPVTTGDLRSALGALAERVGDVDEGRQSWERIAELLHTTGERHRAQRERWAEERAAGRDRRRGRRRRDRAEELAPRLRATAARIADLHGLELVSVDGAEARFVHPTDAPTIRAPDGTVKPAPWLADAERAAEMYREQAEGLLTEAPAAEPAGERS